MRGYTIRKTFKFEAAHFLEHAYSTACMSVHGHSYVVEVFVRADQLNKDGMVIDFGQLKDVAGNLIDSFDHALIIKESEKDHPLSKAEKVVTMKENPTAENMARHFFEKIRSKLIDNRSMDNERRGLRLVKVRVHETKTGWAEYEG